MSSPTGNLAWQDLTLDQDSARSGSTDLAQRNATFAPATTSNADQSPSSPPPRRAASRSQKAVAACTGAVATSLLMTPFDVIKTRLQTQSSAEPLFRPSSHLHPPVSAASSEASTSRNKLPPPSKAHTATCCQQTFFTGNTHEDKLTCRFDPRLEEQTKASAGSGGASGGNSRSHHLQPRSSPLSRPQPHRPPHFSGTPPYAHTTAFSHPASISHAYAHPSSTCAFIDRGTAAMQLEASSRNTRMNGMWDGVVKVSRAEGIKGLWRGLSPTLLMTIPSQVTYMTCYDHFRSVFLALEPKKTSSIGLPTPPSQNSTNITTHTLLSSLGAGACARSVSATLVTPLELVRTRLQASDVSHSMRSIVTSLSQQVSREGPIVLFRGLSSTLWRDVPFSAIYFMGYETLKRILTGGNGLGEGEAKGSLEEFGVAFLAGAVSGSVAAVATHPFDLVKTRLQASMGPTASQHRAKAVENSSTQPRAQDGRSNVASAVRIGSSSRTLSALRTIFAEEGPMGLFRGLAPRVAKVAPACGLMIGSYEAVGTLFALADAD